MKSFGSYWHSVDIGLRGASVSPNNELQPEQIYDPHDYVIKWKHFPRYSGPLCGEFTGPLWIPLTKASNAELWYFLWSALEQTVE